MTCKSCGAAIVWMKTAAGKSIPVDAETATADPVFVPGRHRAHFATCPNAKGHRQPREKKQRSLFGDEE